MDNNDSSDSIASKDKPNSDSPVRIKDEPPDDIKDYAENTMNELLGWYGYDKVNSADTQDLNLERYTASGPEEAASPDDSADEDVDSLCSDDDDDSLSGKSDFSRLSLSRSNSETSLAAQHRNLVSALTKKHGLTGAPDGTLPSGYITCAWCQKPGVKLFTLRTSSTTKAFCSEVCFTQCRRASFKKNKVCDWCKHVRHTVNYVDFQDGEQQLQFCSSKCLNQYKMKIFCKETQEHLQQIQSQTEGNNTASKSPDKQILITPDLWMKESKSDKKYKEKRNSSESLEKDEKDKNRSPSKSDWKSESRKSSLMSPASLTSDREKLSPSHRIIHDRVGRERHRRSSTKDSTNLASPQYNIRDNSPVSGASNTNSALFSNTGFPAMPQWFPPHMWNTFAPGLSPMGPIPPWFYTGMFPQPGFIPPGAAAMPENLIRQSNSRVSTPTPNRNMMSPDTSNSSPSSTPNTPKTPTSRHTTSSNNNHSSVKHSVTNPPFHGLGQPHPPMLTVDPNAIPPPPGMVNGMSHLPGMPPVTMIMPVPVPLPMPVPIPLPLPVKMEHLMKFFDEKKEEARRKEKLLQESEAAKSANSPTKSSYDKNSMDVKPSRLFSKNDVNENGIEQRDCVSCASFQSERSNSVYSCPDLSESYSSIHDLSTHKRALTPRIDGSLDLTKRAKLELISNDSCDGVIDLSSKDGGKYKMSPGKENRDNNDSDISQEEGEIVVNGEYSLKVPRIHIITPRSEPPLSQQLPLPPAEHKYSNRRGLILDAPCVPKRQRSPSPERRSYVRSVPRDVMEAARRRCLRARIRTK